MNQQTTETDRDYIPVRVYCTGEIYSDPRHNMYSSLVAEYRHTDDHEHIGTMTVRTKFYQTKSKRKTHRLFMETEIGYPFIPVPFLKLPDVNLGMFEPISGIFQDINPNGKANLCYIDEKYIYKNIGIRMLWEPIHVATYLRLAGQAMAKKSDNIVKTILHRET